jgi:hypothetical protein
VGGSSGALVGPRALPGVDGLALEAEAYVRVMAGGDADVGGAEEFLDDDEIDARVPGAEWRDMGMQALGSRTMRPPLCNTLPGWVRGRGPTYAGLAAPHGIPVGARTGLPDRGSGGRCLRAK